MSTEVQNLFDTISPTYDTLNHVLSFGIDKGWRKKSLATLSQNKFEPMKALDLCAGTLDFSLEFLKQYPKATATSLDFSQNMLDYGRRKIKKEDLSRIELVCGDALQLSFPDNSFDVVFCAYGMRNLDDNEKGLREIYRVLKPGGTVLILEFFKPITPLSRLFHTTYGKFLLPTVGGWLSGQKDAYAYLHSSIQKYYTLNSYNDLLKKVGFNSIINKDFLLKISSFVSGVK